MVVRPISALVAALAALAVLALLGIVARGQAPLPATELGWVFPPGGAAGTAVGVEVGGDVLDGMGALETSVPGAGVRVVGMEPDAFGVPPRREARTFEITVPETCPPGAYEVRARGRYGLSPPRLFVVVGGPTVMVGEGSHAPAEAFSLAPGTSAFGRVEDDRVDHFVFGAAAGESAVFVLAAGALGSRLDPVLEVVDGRGRRLASAFDPVARNPQVEFRAPEDGTYYLLVSDAVHEGGAEYFYRLDRAAEGVTPAGEHAFDALPLGTSGEAAGPALAEVEPNDEVGSATPVGAPSVVSGGFDGFGDADWFRLPSPGSGSWWIEATAHRLGRPVDVAMVLYALDGDGKVGARLWEADDMSLTSPLGTDDIACRDAAAEVLADGATSYALRVENRAGTRGAAAGYRLAVRRPEPGFEMVFGSPDPTAENRQVRGRAPVFRDGGTVAFRVVAWRRDGFGGEIRVEAGGLGDGLEAAPTFIPAGESETLLVVRHRRGEAVPGCWDGAVKVVGTADIGGERVTREARFVVLDRPVADSGKEPWTVRPAGGCSVSVVEEAAAIEIRISDGVAPQVELTGRTEVPFTVTTHGELKGEVRVVAVGIPGLRKPPEAVVPAAGGEGRLAIEAVPNNDNQWKAGRFPLVLRAEAKLDYARSAAEAGHWKAEGDRVAMLEKDAAQAVETGRAGAVPAEEMGAREARVAAAKEALARVRAFAKEAEDRAKPAERRAVAFSDPVGLAVVEPAGEAAAAK